VSAFLWLIAGLLLRVTSRRFSLPAGDAALSGLRSADAIDFHPVAVVNFVMQLNRTTVDTQLVFRQIDIITQRQQPAGDNRLLDRRPSSRVTRCRYCFSGSA
jgi:hypothetical protein